MLETDYVHAEPLKPAPPVPVRVFRRSQFRAALRQHERPIVIEDQDLARPFVRLLRARDMKLRPLGGLVAEMLSCTIRRCYGSDIRRIGISADMFFREMFKGDPQIEGAPTLRPVGREPISTHHRALALPHPVAALRGALAVAGAGGADGGGRSSIRPALSPIEAAQRTQSPHIGPQCARA